MADDRYGYWIADQSPYRTGPTTAGALVAFALLALVLLALFTGPQATAEGARSIDRGEGVSFCEQHRGEPAWDAICRDAPGGRQRPSDGR